MSKVDHNNFIEITIDYNLAGIMQNIHLTVHY